MSRKVSIIIVSYNNWETTTRDCLESLLSDESNSAFEIIVVDNNSQDKTPEMLQEFVSKYENITIKLNRNNRGFAGGNNDGVRMASGDVVVLLNSDTIVPCGAIESLTSQLRQHDNWAMLGPVTNQAGNEQKIYTESKKEAEIIREGVEWCRHSNGDCFESFRLDFCCVAIKKKVYQTLGGLDESFGLGYYEDTDFSLKTLSQGYHMFFTESVFIYHKAGESFASHKKKAVKQLMKKNKRILQKKYHGQFKLEHIRDCNLKILKQYDEQMKEKADTSYDNIQYRFQRRLRFAQTLYPNNPIKKLRYWLQLKSFF